VEREAKRLRVPKEVGLALAPNEFLIAAGAQTFRGLALDGRYPDTDSVIPAAGAVFHVQVDAKYLIDLLSVAAAFAPDPAHPSVRLLFWSPKTPIGVLAGAGGVFFDGLLMPLS
jgi:hypothetical protein